MKFTAWYCLIVGVLMLVSWVFFFVAGQVPEVQTEPYRIATHLVAEAVTAVALIVAGIGILQQRTWAAPTALVALGMLLYTVINSPGYFAQQSVWPLVAMFVALLLLALVSLRLLFRAL